MTDFCYFTFTVILIMRLSSKGRYAVTVMLDIILHSDKRPVLLAEISERQSVSLSYLEQLFSYLRKQKLVAGVREPDEGVIC